MEQQGPQAQQDHKAPRDLKEHQAYLDYLVKLEQQDHKGRLDQQDQQVLQGLREFKVYQVCLGFPAKWARPVHKVSFSLRKSEICQHLLNILRPSRRVR